MIIYDLTCRQGHRFEGWFPKPADFDAQKERGLLSCQVCGDHCIEKVLTGGKYLHRSAAQSAPQQASVSSTQAHSVSSDVDAVTVLKAIRQYVTANFENVGPKFAETVRAINRGEQDDRPVYGQATPEEREQLEEEGLPCAVLPELGDEYKN